MARLELRVDEPVGDAVALVRRFIADQNGLLLLDKEILDRLDQDVRALLLMRGPEGSAEIVTVLAAQLAGLMTMSAPQTAGEAYTALVTGQIDVTRERERFEQDLFAGPEADQAGEALSGE
ncbi:hypothetical protein ACFCZ6_14410 [Streptomyces hydrogenans]|uniref:hypothetical protein n=1 Tax=Streptomyces hydrogenans TaxID=1873719 RepID=UPI0035D6F7F8